MVWSALGVSVAGTAHRTRNISCQDACRFHTFGAPEEWLVVVAADGAGSASHSEIGANLACDEFVRRVESLEPLGLFAREAMTSLFGEVRGVLLAEAERLTVRPRELACTALLAVVGPDRAAFAQVGDGAIVFGGEDHRVVFWPEPAEYANATDFLTQDSFEGAIRFETVVEAVAEIAMFTDGLQRLALDFAARGAFSGFFRPLFRALRAADDPKSLVEPFRDFLDSERVNQRTDDDKTLVLAARRP